MAKSIERSNGLTIAMFEKNWKTALEGYRQLLFDKGLATQKIGQKTISENLAKNVLQRKWKVEIGVFKKFSGIAELTESLLYIGKL